MTTPSIDLYFPFKVVTEKKTSNTLIPVGDLPAFFPLSGNKAYNVHVRNQASTVALVYLNHEHGDSGSKQVMRVEAGSSGMFEVVSTEDKPAYLHVRGASMPPGEQVFLTIMPMPLNKPEV